MLKALGNRVEQMGPQWSGGAAWKDLLGDPIMVTGTPWTKRDALRDKGVLASAKGGGAGTTKARDGEAQRTGCLGCGSTQQFERMTAQ